MRDNLDERIHILELRGIVEPREIEYASLNLLPMLEQHYLYLLVDVTEVMFPPGFAENFIDDTPSLEELTEHPHLRQIVYVLPNDHPIQSSILKRHNRPDLRHKVRIVRFRRDGEEFLRELARAERIHPYPEPPADDDTEAD